MHASRCGWRSGMFEAGSGADSTAPTHEEIERLAYSYWESRGKQGGSATDDWLRAERELKERQPH